MISLRRSVFIVSDHHSSLEVVDPSYSVFSWNRFLVFHCRLSQILWASLYLFMFMDGRRSPLSSLTEPLWLPISQILWSSWVCKIAIFFVNQILWSLRLSRRVSRWSKPSIIRDSSDFENHFSPSILTSLSLGLIYGTWILDHSCNSFFRLSLSDYF